MIVCVCIVCVCVFVCVCVYLYIRIYIHTDIHTCPYYTVPSQEEIASRRKEISSLMKKTGGLPSAALRSQMEDLIVKKEKELRKVEKQLSFQAGVNENKRRKRNRGRIKAYWERRKTTHPPSRHQSNKSRGKSRKTANP
jgi:hypothetical protein